MKKSLIKLLCLGVFSACASCSTTVTEKADSTKIEPDSSLTKNQLTDSVAAQSSQAGNNALTQIYIKAISGYMDAIYQKDQTVFDTLFFIKHQNGQPDDFPAIELPGSINGTKLILLTQEEADKNKATYNKTTPCINLFGWVDSSKAEFTFVTFYPNFDHQYDCYINYIFNSSRKDYDLEKITIEVLAKDKNGKPDHFEIFEDGKHIGDKSIE